jgi:hypothetical protein
LENYDRAIRSLSKTNRDTVLETVEAQNRIEDLLSGVCECATIDSLPEDMREPICDLFGFAFDLLTDLEIRDRQYTAIYEAVPDRMCPFCGTEYFDAPKATREALDHYLTKTLYPFAAANLRNLVPMGHKCNSGYKLATDLLRCTNGSRRVAFDPYNHTNVRVLLDDSDPFDGATMNTPRWHIRFDPDVPAVQTWDEVFSVRERYRRDHLNPSFASWLEHFGKWARSLNPRPDTDETLLDALRRFETFYSDCGMQDRAFLKAAVFRMLRLHCEHGNQRLIEVLRNVVAPGGTTNSAFPSAVEGAA